MKSIAILTATRAEYGLLSPVIKALKRFAEYEVRVVATGAHLSPEFGMTYKEIEEDGIEIDKKIEILLSADTPSSISKSMGLAVIGFADYFAERRPDALLVLGDRYETLAVCLAAMNERIPIIHLYGGETTEGAVDEAVRHCITKLSYLHLTSIEEYKRRVIQLGEHPDRVVTVGALGVENALRQPLMNRKELEESLGWKLEKPYAVVTFHPVTLEECSAEEQCRELQKALDAHQELQYIITKANADSDGRVINQMMEDYVSNHANAKLFDSLGMVRYLSVLKYADMMIGNSSSGLVEGPSFHIPTVNIGDRQKGRIRTESVIDCAPVCGDICRAMEKAESEEFRRICSKVINPYGNGDTMQKIVGSINTIMKKEIDIKKIFYDLN